MQNIFRVQVIRIFYYRLVTGSPSREGNMQPAPSKQWCTIDRLCRTSSLYAKGQHIHNKMLNTNLLLHIEDRHNLRRKLNCLVQASICNNNVPLLIRIVRCLYYQHITKFHITTQPWPLTCSCSARPGHIAAGVAALAGAEGLIYRR